MPLVCSIIITITYYSFFMMEHLHSKIFLTITTNNNHNNNRKRKSHNASARTGTREKITTTKENLHVINTLKCFLSRSNVTIIPPKNEYHATTTATTTDCGDELLFYSQQNVHSMHRRKKKLSARENRSMSLYFLLYYCRKSYNHKSTHYTSMLT